MTSRGGHHPHNDPAAAIDHLMPPNVRDVLPAVAAMLIAVVLGGHLVVLPTHVEQGDGLEAVKDGYLSGRYGQPRVNQ